MKNICKTHFWLPNCNFEAAFTVTEAWPSKTKHAQAHAAASAVDVIFPYYPQALAALAGSLKIIAKPGLYFNTLYSNHFYNRNRSSFANRAHLSCFFMLSNREFLQPDIYPEHFANGMASKSDTLTYCDL